MNNDNSKENRNIFSSRFKEVLAIRKVSIAKFGKMFFPTKKKSTIGYYFLNAPNITIYSLCKISVLLRVDIIVFFQDELEPLEELNENDIERYYNTVLRNIARNIKRIRENRSDLILDIEVLANIDSSNLSKIENAKSNLSIVILTRIANVLNTNIQALLKWS